MTELNKKRLFLLDMDGTLYLGSNLFDVTPPFLDYIKSIGGKAMFLTNNSSKSVSKYVEKLASLGIDAAEDDFLTSSQATCLYLNKNHPCALVYAFGTESFVNELKRAGINVTCDLTDGIECVVMGFDTELTFKKLEDASKLLLDKNVAYIATNPDFVCPTEWGSVPDCGSISICLEHSTGRKPFVIGKPKPEMALLAMEKADYTPEETILVGDRLYTDIACGVNAGIDTVLVLSGESTMETVRNSDIKPSYIMKDVGELLEKCKS